MGSPSHRFLGRGSTFTHSRSAPVSPSSPSSPSAAILGETLAPGTPPPASTLGVEMTRHGALLVIAERQLVVVASHYDVEWPSSTGPGLLDSLRRRRPQQFEGFVFLPGHLASPAPTIPRFGLLGKSMGDAPSPPPRRGTTGARLADVLLRALGPGWTTYIRCNAGP